MLPSLTMIDKKKDYELAFAKTITQGTSQNSVFWPRFNYENRENHPFIVHYLNYCSKFFLSPFWVKWDPSKGAYIAVSSLPRKFLCGLVLLWELAVTFWRLYWDSPLQGLDIVVQTLGCIFSLVSYISTTPISWLILINLWLQKGIVMQRINIIREEAPEFAVSTKKAYLLCFLVHILNIYNLIPNPCMYEGVAQIMEEFGNFAISDRTWASFWKKMDDHYDFERNETIVMTSSPTSVLLFKHACSAFYFILQSLISSEKTTCLIVIFSMWVVVDNFGKKISSPKTNLKEGLEMYKSHRRIWNLTNELWQWILLCLYISSLAYYSKVQRIGNVDAIHFTLFGIETTLVFGVSSHLHYKVTQIMRTWISEKHEEKGLSLQMKLRLHMLSQDIVVDPIGFSSCFFTFSYQVLGSMLGLLITYAIIIYQAGHK